MAVNVENLVLTGTEPCNGTGNSSINQLTGNDGENRLDGLAGADTMIGHGGNDVYVVDNTHDSIQEIADEGYDLVESTVNHELASNVECLILKGKAAINGTGNALNNLLTGNDANNTLNGRDGNDILNGGNGCDTYTGGDGNDVFVINRVSNLAATITDFMQDTDKLGLGQSSFGQLFEGGALRAGVFGNGAAAFSAEQRLFYNALNGGLYYDQDGIGVKAAVQVAALANKPAALSSGDFILTAGV